MGATRDELWTGGILGLLLGVAVTVVLSQRADHPTGEDPAPLTPLRMLDAGSDLRDDALPPEPAPVRVGVRMRPRVAVPQALSS